MNLLPATFRRVRVELAREPGHPAGSAEDGYEFVVPLSPEGRIDLALWRKHKTQCRVRRFDAKDQDRYGRLVHRSGGRWVFDYDPATSTDDEVGFRFGDEMFTVGEYVSIEGQNGMHAYRVILVEPP